MDHRKAEQSLAVERYLLEELSPEEQDAFEEHFFCCEECARQVKLGAAFMSHAKEGLKSMPVEAPAVTPRKRVSRPWTSWFSPAFAIPALALMLGIVVFQNLVQFPAMHQELVAMNAPSVMPNVDLKSGSARGEGSVVTAPGGALFQLTLDIPDSSSVAHSAELQNASGQRLWTLPIAADAPKDALALKMPGDLPAGNYVLIVRQAGSATSEVSRYAFELRRN